MDHWQKNELQMSYSSNGFSLSSLMICASDLAVTEALIGQGLGFDANTQLNPLCSRLCLQISLLVSTGLIRLLFRFTRKALGQTIWPESLTFVISHKRRWLYGCMWASTGHHIYV